MHIFLSMIYCFGKIYGLNQNGTVYNAELLYIYILKLHFFNMYTQTECKPFSYFEYTYMCTLQCVVYVYNYLVACLNCIYTYIILNLLYIYKYTREKGDVVHHEGFF